MRCAARGVRQSGGLSHGGGVFGYTTTRRRGSATKQVAIFSKLTSFLEAILAFEISRVAWLKRQFCNSISATGAGPFALEHFALSPFSASAAAAVSA